MVFLKKKQNVSCNSILLQFIKPMFPISTRLGWNIPPTAYKAILGKPQEVFSLHDPQYQGDHKASLVRDLLVMGGQDHFPNHGI